MIAPVISLIRSGTLAPATCIPMKSDRESTADAVRAACEREGIKVRVTHNGPHGAVVALLDPDRCEHDIRSALGTGYRFGWSQYGLVVRRRL
jgi:hypothetical protein